MYIRTGAPGAGRIASAALAAALLAGGCAASDGDRRHETLASALSAERPPVAPTVERSAAEGEPFPVEGTLDRTALVAAVLARNPSLAAARAAARAALARYPQATALDDPMLSYELAPISAFSSHAQFGQTVRVSQRLPWPGKRALAGEAALAEAEAMQGELAETRQSLALAASLLFDDYFVAHRALAIARQHTALLEELRAAADARFETGQAALQAPLLAEVELARVEREELALQAELATLRARLNALLRRPPEAPLPPPPEALPVAPADALDGGALQAAALRNRPEVAAARARLAAAESRTALADRGWYPDFEVMGTYSSMWEETPHQWMAGVALNLPLQLDRRRAAVDEAGAEAAGLRRRIEALEDDIRSQVDQAVARIAEARAALRLFEQRLLPIAEEQIEAAQAGFITGRNDFSALIEAERNLRDVQLGLVRAQADLARRQAELQRVVGAEHQDTGGER